jgi:hypothetical protein
MHRPGYVQGGQEANCGYLLLGIYYRRIPGDIDIIPALTSSKTILYSCDLSTSRSHAIICRLDLS